MKSISFFLLFFFSSHCYFAQTVNLSVDPSLERKPISPWIYGRNNNLSGNPSQPTTLTNLTRYRDAGLRMFREGNGNNSTKYNWKRKLTSHPDWYNNVYSQDWDYKASVLLNQTGNTMGLFSFQLLGKVASSNQYNFNDWAYNNSQYWSGVTNNWAGGGGPDAGNGNPDLYLMNWPADSTTAIIPYWKNTLGYNMERLKYWSMDNEPEIWQYTHDDAIGAITADQYLEKYITVAKKARELYPDIKLIGPISPNEWQWYAWNNTKVTDPDDGNQYCWMEYFIKKIAKEQNASGIKLLDVLAVHFYPNTQSNIDLTLQLHRVWFDRDYIYPQANGVKLSGTSGWDNNINKEYFFGRCEDWLTKYMGTDHKVSFGVTECGAINTNPNVVSCWYASHLGTFANNGVEIFTPWDWYTGQWEILNLFSNYFGKIAVKTTSDNETFVSGYSSVSADGDSLMIAIVNRDKSNSRPVRINLNNYIPSASVVNGFRISGLPSTETFNSKTSNALQNLTFNITEASIEFTAPSLSVTMIQIPTDSPVTGAWSEKFFDLKLYPNPGSDKLFLHSGEQGEYKLTIRDALGKTILEKRMKSGDGLDISSVIKGVYFIEIGKQDESKVIKFIKE
ncbi:MAG: glycoside hydrolase family 44 protein [Cytophagaceae bacterium]